MKADVRLIVTADGSHTAINQALDKTYHSIHGAFQESQRVYIELGLLAAFDAFPNEELHIFEMGFGTGLNALLTAREATTHQRHMRYTAIDAYPMAIDDAKALNFDDLLATDYLAKLHESPWHQPIDITPWFTLTKVESRLQDWQTTERFHLIYYDAFAPTAQPELWEPEIFVQLAHLLLPNGMLTTYCSRSYVQRNMRAAGLTVEKHAGPLHKRDILRAIKMDRTG
ncbi:tRNA (5-methylaminomethyl-2-thiouridine)(34)-methyltransferase MnmD [Spirosoma sp. KCTC 42546]|uniref:tRNA (5-methylaminomethyl-2-thiouridine)(34)-methyltransferase MnmD n=1 Tax=Spirosoma sp. KCTC 42546 TaxID=2520506 RepID=UPI00115A5C57|nr:tRNA (5-methylaminomethyl-2-thiouridine)(34)-methyltransferase MnmD [Spirosoma sp. KCTC 42546]QDK82434.1 tRNA (5-methylaminomethyl-2-thiouridine)(34)-methyltransferase MnmD [Spirosoma sp. KCTC 42546]